MLKVSDYEKSITLAVNERLNLAICACKWGNNWQFVIDSKDGMNCGRIGQNYRSKQELLNDAYTYIIDESGYQFKDSDLLPIVTKLTPVYLNNDQITSLNTAYRLLTRSNSDHADQAACYIKQIIENVKSLK
ncbi:hypothetical protein S140_227 [Shewanella sp. phage 1/40]|uniref:hypothetical protein n=1 Tax=Shewanella sp. phage 1/40 TaxID=1458860 RepID=UPI0004F5D5AF|nr:hypothetical protein S140_227 [Shewanella sp. phage 1/40]AHK11634.1 hypothetical protein S140_227 [Shewanella sp. phage 1/40]